LGRGHGTSCAGIICATHNNIGIAGIAPNCSIMPISVDFGSGNYEYGLAKAIRWAWKNGGADVLSLTSNPELVMNLKTKKIDCAIMEEFVAKSFSKANDDLLVVEGISIDSGSEGVAIALKKGNDGLTEKLNEIIADAKAKGLVEEWFLEAFELYN